MFHGKPGYALDDLKGVARVDVRLYIAERDNVHLPYFSAQIAGAITGVSIAEVSERMAKPFGNGADVFAKVFAEENCGIWLVPHAGRLACMVNFRDALKNLVAR